MLRNVIVSLVTFAVWKGQYIPMIRIVMAWAVSFLLSWDQDFVRAVLIPSFSLLFLSQSDVHSKELREKWVELLGYRTIRFRVWTPLFYSLTTSICVKCQLADFFFSCYISRGLGGEVGTERIYLSLFFFCFHVFSLSLTQTYTHVRIHVSVGRGKQKLRWMTGVCWRRA